MDNLLFTTKPAALDAVRLSFRPDTKPDAASAKALGEVAAYYFESGLSNYSAWAQQMTSELGGAVQPYLREAWRRIPQKVSSRGDEIASSLLTQAQRVAVVLRRKDLIATWQDSEGARSLSEEPDVSPHDHFCPVCADKWMCDAPECFLPDEYWCKTHTGSQPLPHRRTFHDHLCLDCECYWGHNCEWCLLPEVYECEEHGGVIDKDFLRAPSVGNLSQTATNYAELQRYAPVVACILALLMAFFSRWPYGFYVLLRLGVCTVSVYGAVEMFKQQRTMWAWALGANAVLYNPVLPIHMARSDWEIINLLDALFLVAWATASFYRERRRPHDTHSASGKNEP